MTRQLLNSYDKKSKPLLLSVLAGGLLFGGVLRAAELTVQSAAGAPGQLVEVPILLNPQGDGVAALVFEVEYDATKLRFHSGGATGEFEHGDYFSADLSSTAGRVGVSVYDPEAPVLPLAAGVAATLRFLVLPEAQGFATVSIGGRRPDGADTEALPLTLTVTLGRSGVAISSGRSRAVRTH